MLAVRLNWTTSAFGLWHTRDADDRDRKER